MIEKRNGKYVLSMVQGDTETVTVRMKEAQTDGTMATKNFVSGDKITLTAKKIGATDALFTPVTATASASVDSLSVTIPATATASVAASDYDYVFDIQCDFKDGTVKTLVPRSPFVLIEEVTD